MVCEYCEFGWIKGLMIVVETRKEEPIIKTPTCLAGFIVTEP